MHGSFFFLLPFPKFPNSPPVISLFFDELIEVVFLVPCLLLCNGQILFHLQQLDFHFDVLCLGRFQHPLGFRGLLQLCQGEEKGEGDGRIEREGVVNNQKDSVMESEELDM